MIDMPFKILSRFPANLRLGMLTKSDGIQSDADIAECFPDVPLASVAQVHGNRTVVLREPASRAIEADGLITDRKNLLLTIRWADCQNFVVYAPEKHVVGLLHAGWRGLEAGAIENFFAALKREWGIKPEETAVGAGPSLGFDCAEFTDPRREMPSMNTRFIRGRHADLQAAATDKLLKLGVRKERIERSPDCTKYHPDLYWTYRGGHREEVQAGKTNVLAAALRD